MAHPIQQPHPARAPHAPAGSATIIFGVISVVGAVLLLLNSFASLRLVWWLVPILLLIGVIGSIASSKSNRGTVAGFCAVQGVALVPLTLLLITNYWHLYPIVRSPLCGLISLVGAIGVIVTGLRGRSFALQAAASSPPRPAGYTDDGRPFYPIVGYTSDGNPVTADRAAAYRQPSTGTNSMAIMAFVLSLVLAPLAIPFGHIARTQIRQTGEQGAGLASAGLIIGYLWLALLVVVLLVWIRPF